MSSTSESKQTSGTMGKLVKIFTLGIVALLAFGISTTSQRLNAG